MSKYTTGEIAKLCNVTVRTVQYYDTRGILSPSELTEGGRRLYSESDLQKMKTVCFLRELGISLDGISKILSEDNAPNVISLLLEQQEQTLKAEIGERKEKLEKLEQLKSGLSKANEVSVESIGDIAYTMNNKNDLKKTRRTMLLSAIPIFLLEAAGVALWIIKGWWWAYAAALVIAIPWAIWCSRYYYRSVAYICPECHKVFKPTFKQMFWASHTPKTRKLTCPECGRRGYCVEVADENNTKGEK